MSDGTDKSEKRAKQPAQLYSETIRLAKILAAHEDRFIMDVIDQAVEEYARTHGTIQGIVDALKPYLKQKK